MSLYINILLDREGLRRRVRSEVLMALGVAAESTSSLGLKVPCESKSHLLEHFLTLAEAAAIDAVGPTVASVDDGKLVKLRRPRQFNGAAVKEVADMFADIIVARCAAMWFSTVGENGCADKFELRAAERQQQLRRLLTRRDRPSRPIKLPVK